jgi:hypothetical protein
MGWLGSSSNTCDPAASLWCLRCEFYAFFRMRADLLKVIPPYGWKIQGVSRRAPSRIRETRTGYGCNVAF